MDGMLAEMTSSEFARWWAFYTIEPWGAAAENHRAGMIAATVANMKGKQVRAGKVMVPQDYFPPRTPKPVPAGIDVRAQVHAVFGPLAGRTVTNGDDR